MNLEFWSRRRNRHGPILSIGAAIPDGFALASGSAERRPTTEIFVSTPW